MTDNTAYRARQREILRQFSNLGFQIEPGDKKLTVEQAAKELDNLFLEVVGGDENEQDDRFRDSQGNVTLGATSYVAGRNKLRQSIRKVIQGKDK